MKACIEARFVTKCIRTAALVVLLGPAAVPDAAAMHLLVYGDSLSAAYNMPLERGWVALLAAELEGRHRVSNASITNESSAGGLARLPQTLEAFKPDVVLLELGAVDALAGRPLSLIRDNLEKMLDLIERSGARAIVGGIRIPASYGPRYADEFRRLYEDLAARRGLPFVQLYIESIGFNPDLMQTDGVHPKEEAQPMVRDYVLEFLRDAGFI